MRASTCPDSGTTRIQGPAEDPSHSNDDGPGWISMRPDESNSVAARRKSNTAQVTPDARETTRPTSGFSRAAPTLTYTSLRTGRDVGDQVGEPSSTSIQT